MDLIVQIELPGKLLDYFLWSNKSNINQSKRCRDTGKEWPNPHTHTYEETRTKNKEINESRKHQKKRQKGVGKEKKSQS